MILGYDTPALPGMMIDDIVTPCLVVDADALDRNLRKLAEFCTGQGMALRPHGKMHKCPDLAHLQMQHGAVGICAQKVSEAESFARAGLKDILVTNQVRQAVMIDRVAGLARDARIGVLIDDPANVAELSTAARRHGTILDVYIELDCGAGRCGLTDPEDALPLAQRITEAAHLHFAGLHVYQGSAQHMPEAKRVDAIAHAARLATQARDLLDTNHIPVPTITGGGTGSYALETQGPWTELQCGSYAFMDADYARVIGDAFEPALFLLTSVLSHNRPSRAIVDAGLKVQSVDSGLPTVHAAPDLSYTKCSDEHGEVHDPDNRLRINDKLRLIPGHCDPTCNLHDQYVVIRNGQVEALWPISARGKAL